MKKNDQIKVYVVDYGRECLYMRYKSPVTGKYVTRSTEVPTDGPKARKAAESVASKWEAELQEGRYKAPSKVSWAEFRERYESEILPGLAENTASKVAATFNAIEEHVNPARLADLTADRISHLTKRLREVQWSKDYGKHKPAPDGQGKSAPKVMVGLSESTIRGHLAHLKAALNWARKIGMLVEVPKIDLPRRAKKSGKSSPMKGRPITAEEFERMLAKVREIVVEARDDSEEPTAAQLAEEAARVESWQYLLRGLWLSGLRLGEALELWWDRDDKLAIDLSGRYPMLRIRSELEKGNEERLLPMTPDFADFLLATPQADRTGPVFSPLAIGGDAGRPGINWVSKVISSIGDAAGVKVSTDMRTSKVKYASAHDLRRSFGERWSSKVMPTILQQLMRHADISTTLRFYVGKNADTAAAAIWGSVGRRFGNSSGNSKSKSRPDDDSTVDANAFDGNA